MLVTIKLIFCCNCPMPWYFVCQTVALHSWMYVKEGSMCWVHFLIILNNWCSFIKQTLPQLMPKGWGMSFVGDGWMPSTVKWKCLIHVYYFSIYSHEHQDKIELKSYSVWIAYEQIYSRINYLNCQQFSLPNFIDTDWRILSFSFTYTQELISTSALKIRHFVLM